MDLTFPLVRLFGIQVRIHWLYPIVIVGYILRGAFGPDASGLLVGFYSCLMAGLVLTTLLHELGHCFAARSVGGHAEEILLWPLGGLAYVGHGGSPRQDIKVAAMGPLMHLPLAALAAGLILRTQTWQWNYLNVFGSWYPFYPLREQFGSNLALGLFKLQLVLFILNLLVPAYPLDGGRILLDLLLMRFGRDQAAIVITYFSIPIGIGLLIWAFLAADLWFGLMAIGMLFEAWQIRRLVAAGQIEAHRMFADTPEFDYMPGREPPARRKGFFARWRESRARKQRDREAEQVGQMRAKVDDILEKVSREGMSSLTADERKILDDASRRSRGE
jgi:stage IV sporulation protein FB